MKSVIDRKRTCERMKGYVNGVEDIKRLMRACGVSEMAVRKWLSGKSFPTTQHLYTFVSIYGITFEELLVLRKGTKLKGQRS